MGRYKTPTGSVVNVDEDLASKIGGTWEALDTGAASSKTAKAKASSAKQAE